MLVNSWSCRSASQKLTKSKQFSWPPVATAAYLSTSLAYSFISACSCLPATPDILSSHVSSHAFLDSSAKRPYHLDLRSANSGYPRCFGRSETKDLASRHPSRLESIGSVETEESEPISRWILVFPSDPQVCR